VPGPALETTLKLESARLSSPWVDGRILGQGRLRVNRRRIEAGDLTASMPECRLRLGPRVTTPVGPVRLNVTAGATLSGRELRLGIRALDVGGLLLAHGELNGLTLDAMSGTVQGVIPRSDRVRTALAPLLPDRMKAMGITGALPFRLDLSGGGPERALALELLPEGLGFSWMGDRFDVRVGGTLRAEGPLSGWARGDAALSGRIGGTGDLVWPPFAVRTFRFETPLAGRAGAPALPGFHVSIDDGKALYEGRPLPLGASALSGTASLSDGAVRLEGMEIRSASLGRTSIDLGLSGPAVRGRIEARGMPLDNLATLAAAMGERAAAGWSPTGTVDLAATLDPADGDPRLSATATLSDVAFASPAGDVMGQKLGATVSMEGLLGPRPRARTDLALRRGEALWGTVYVDFSKNPLLLRVEGTRAGAQEYRDLALEASFGTFGRVAVQATMRRAGDTWRHDGHLALTGARLAPIFRTFLRDPLAPSHRDLAGLEADGAGRLDLSFSGSGEQARLTGRLQVQGAALRRAPDPPLLSGLELDLPIDYLLGAGHPRFPPPAEGDRWGRIRLDALRVGGESLGPLEMQAAMVPNRLYLRGAVDTSLFGAGLSLRRIRVDDPLSADFRFQAAATLGRLDLAQVVGDNVLLQGHLAGVLDPVTISPERLTAEGELAGDLFGGRVQVRHLTVERPFSAGREPGADVTVERIDLERLSAALGIGRITGRLSGFVDGLRLAYGQPVAFHLRMESVPVEGVRQTVSLKAVNSISLVSTGSALSGLGSSLMTRFFREFPYEKIGFGCDLRNDVFTVRGLIHEDGVEYLVKRGFFGGINVVNRNPDNRIGFSDMVERARRATAERPD